MKKNPVVHFEMPAKDLARVKKFYEEAFGWNMNQLGEDYGNYLMAETTQTENGMPTTPGAINGGFWVPDDNTPSQPPHVVISVDDIKDAISKVKAAGGKVFGGNDPNKKSPEDPDDIPGIGLYVSIEDSEGNIVGILQPAPMG